MQLPLLFTIIFLLLVTSSSGYAQQNPFLTAPKATTNEAPTETTGEPAPQKERNLRPMVSPLPSPFLQQITEWQRVLRTKLSAIIRSIAHEDGGKTLWGFLFLCFLYGVVHALGPGHGKAVVGSYFMSRTGTWKQALLMSISTTSLHVISALMLLYGLHYLATSGNFADFEAQRLRTEQVSYVLLMLIGAGLFVHSAFGWKRSNTAKPLRQADTRSMLSTAAITGMAPCPAVALVSLFCLAHGAPMLGLAGAGAIGLGMAMTTSSFALAFVSFRRGLSRAVSPWKNTAQILHKLLEAGGALFIMLLGWLLWSATRL